MEESHLPEHQNNKQQAVIKNTEIIEREIFVQNTKIHIKSIFGGYISLDDALKKIVLRKLSESDK